MDSVQAGGPIYLEETGARGEGLAEVARRVGTIAGNPVPPGATDAQVLGALSSGLAAVVAAADYTVIAAVRVATTANITLSGLQTVDGVTLAAGDRVLVKDQTTGSANGIYVAASGAWSRASDFDAAGEVVTGAYVPVQAGTQAGAFVLVTQAPITVGTTALVFRLFDFRNADRIPFDASGNGSIARPVADRLREFVSVKDFGAACDGATDDTAAVQAAVNYCNSFARARALRIPGRCLVSASINIDRQVDTKKTEFLIVGEGEGAGFCTNTAGLTFLESSIATTAVPVSERVALQNLHFESSTTGAVTFSKKFLRMRVEGCSFNNVLFINSPFYIQSWRIRNCDFRNWVGTIFSVTGVMFDVDITSNLFEFGQDVLNSSGASGLRFCNNVCESLRRTFAISGGNGVVVSGNYTEANTQRDFTFTDVAGSGVSRGVVFQGNWMSPAHSDWNVGLGDVRGFVGGGNYCTTKLYDLTSTPFGRINTIGDYADGPLSSAPLPIVRGECMAAVETGVTAHAGGGQPSARKLTKPISVVSTVGAINDSVSLLPTDQFYVGIAATQVVVNAGSNSLRVYYDDNDRINFGAVGYWDIPAGQTKIFYLVGQGQVKAF